MQSLWSASSCYKFSNSLCGFIDLPSQYSQYHRLPLSYVLQRYDSRMSREEVHRIRDRSSFVLVPCKR